MAAIDNEVNTLTNKINKLRAFNNNSASGIHQTSDPGKSPLFNNRFGSDTR